MLNFESVILGAKSQQRGILLRSRVKEDELAGYPGRFRLENLNC